MGLNKRLIDQAGGGSFTNTDNFDQTSWTGNGGTLEVSDFNFQPDFLWFRRKDGGTNPYIFDSVRGAGAWLQPNLDEAQGYTGSSLASFDNDGFTLGSWAGLNISSSQWATFGLKGGGSAGQNTDGTLTADVSANPAAGFSIVEFTNTSNTQTIGHGLDSKPELVIQKSIGSASDWYVRTDIIDGSDDFLRLNTNDVKANNTNFGHNNTTFNAWQGAANWICYCFHSVDGYQKVGSFVGDGSTDAVLNLGFEPRWIMIKNTNTTTGWFIMDVERSDFALRLKADVSNGDSSIGTLTTSSTGITISSTASDGRINGRPGYSDTMMYLAIA